MLKLKLLKTFFHRHQAGVAQGLLKDANIESTIEADDAGGAYPHLLLGMGNVRLFVDEKYFSKALDILKVLEEPANFEVQKEAEEQSREIPVESKIIKKKATAPKPSVIVAVLVAILFFFIYYLQNR
jgi:hypothetical protein